MAASKKTDLRGPVGCFICAAPVGTREALFDVHAAGEDHDTYRLCAVCGESVRKEIELSARRGRYA
jgi:hypothetical protein